MARRTLVNFPKPRYQKCKDLCRIPYCRNRKEHRRTICSKHHSAWYKAAHPLRYHFNLLRCGAKRRKIEFTLTFACYERLAKESGLETSRGKMPDALSIDRKDSSKGYSDDNVRVCTISENSQKGNRYHWSPYLSKMFTNMTDDEPETKQANCPF